MRGVTATPLAMTTTYESKAVVATIRKPGLANPQPLMI